MLVLYRWFLYLYPPVYRREYAGEMMSVFRDAQTDARAGSFGRGLAFHAREIWGLLAGAAHERIHVISGSYPSISFRRFDMRPEFRFPRSTVVLMSIILGGVIVAMEKATTIQIKYGAVTGSIWSSLAGFFALTLLSICAAAVIWGILFALGRAGTHRLAGSPNPDAVLCLDVLAPLERDELRVAVDDAEDAAEIVGHLPRHPRALLRVGSRAELENRDRHGKTQSMPHAQAAARPAKLRFGQ